MIDPFLRTWVFLGLLLASISPLTQLVHADEPIEFIKVGANAFLEVSQESCSVQIIRAQGSKSEPSGMFVHIANSNIPLQFFNPRDLKPDQTLISAFLEFKSGKMSLLHLNRNQWQVGGSFSLLFPCNVKVNYDGNNNYLTVTKQNKSFAAMVGFLGLSSVINGKDSVTVLEAAAQGRLLTPYSATGGEITLANKPLPPESTIGLQIEEKRSACLAPNAIFLDQTAYEQVRAEPDAKKKAEIIKKGLKSKPEKDPRGSLVILRSESPVVGYNPETDDFSVLNEVSISAKAKICSVAPLDVQF